MNSQSLFRERHWSRCAIRELAGPLLVLLLSAAIALGQAPVPYITEPLIPTAIAPGSSGFTLTVHGTGFVKGAVIRWNETTLATTFVSGSELTAVVPASMVADAGTVAVTVANPGTALASNVLPLHITQPSTTVFYDHAPDSPLYLGLGPIDGIEIQPLSMGAGDFNGDGNLDLALALQEHDNPGSAVVFLGDGTGRFSPAASTTIGHGAFSMAVGDFNGDGKLDIALANYHSDPELSENSVTVLLGNGDGTTQIVASSFPTGSQPAALAAADFDGDGKLDLAVANLGDNTLTVLTGNGDGTFNTTPESSLLTSALSLSIADIDGDGILDLAGSNGAASSVSILFGDGEARFTLGIPAQAVSSHALVAADFNGDRQADLAVSSRGGERLKVLLGNGHGAFSAVPDCCGELRAFTHSLAIATGDFNGDGNLDLVESVQTVFPGIFTLDYLNILLGDGDGAFIPTNYSMLLHNDPYDLALGDFNNDGKLDIAASSNPENFVSMLVQAAPPEDRPDFLFSAPASEATISAGDTASFEVQIFSKNGFNGPVVLSCSGAPQHSTCELPELSTFLLPTLWRRYAVSVVTSGPASSNSIPASRGSQRGSPSLPWTAILAGILLATPIYRTKKNGALLRAGLWCLVAILFLVSCGGSGHQSQPTPTPSPTPTPTPTPVEPTPAGTYSLTVTAASGNISHSTTLTLVVQ